MSGTATFDPALVLSSILRRNATVMNTTHGFVALVDPDSDCMTIEYGMGLAENYVGRQLSEQDGVAWNVYTTGSTFKVSHYGDWEGKFRGILPKNRDQIGSVAGAPAIVNGTVRAVLVFIFESEELADERTLGQLLAQVTDSASSVLGQLETRPDESKAISVFEAPVLPVSNELPSDFLPSMGTMDQPPGF
jgi:hypothetical protein